MRASIDLLKFSDTCPSYTHNIASIQYYLKLDSLEISRNALNLYDLQALGENQLNPPIGLNPTFVKQKHIDNDHTYQPVEERIEMHLRRQRGINFKKIARNSF